MLVKLLIDVDQLHVKFTVKFEVTDSKPGRYKVGIEWGLWRGAIAPPQYAGYTAELFLFNLTFEICSF